MPEVSVILPTYNRAHFLAEAIQSVLDQTFQHIELLVVDDGSMDDTERTVAQFVCDGRVRFLRQRHGGDSRARSTGIKNSRGKVLAFLDSDDLWMPEKLEKQVSVLRKHADISVVYTAVVLQHVDERRREVSRRIARSPASQESTLYEELLYRNVITGSQSSVMVRREALDRVGSFDEDLPFMGDHDLWRRLAQRDSFYYLDEPLVCIRKHSANVSRNVEMMTEYYLQYFDKLSRQILPQYRYHLPRVALFRFTLFSLRLLRQGKLLPACRAARFAFRHTFQNPAVMVGLLLRFSRLLRGSREFAERVQLPAGRPSSDRRLPHTRSTNTRRNRFAGVASRTSRGPGFPRQ